MVNHLPTSRRNLSHLLYNTFKSDVAISPLVTHNVLTLINYAFFYVVFFSAAVILIYGGKANDFENIVTKTWKISIKDSLNCSIKLKTWPKKKLLIMRNFTLGSVFKSRLLLLRQNASAGGKGLIWKLVSCRSLLSIIVGVLGNIL